MNPATDPHRRKVSIKRRAADPGTVTSSAAHAAIQQVVDQREARKVVRAVRQSGDPRPSRAAPRGTPVALHAFRVLVFAGIVIVLWQAVAGLIVRRPHGPDPARCGFSGVATLAGKPLAQAMLELHPLEAGSAAVPLPLETDHAGAFSRPASHGVAAGRYAVVVQSGCVMRRPDAEIGTPVAIPARYRRPESTPLQIEVKDSARLDLALTR